MRRLGILMIALLLIVGAVSVVQAQGGTLIVTPANMQGWTTSPWGTPPTAGFVATRGNPGPGSFYTEISASSSKIILYTPYANFPLSDLSQISYNTYTLAGTGTGGVYPYYVNIYISDGNAATGSWYDWRLDYQPTGAINTWQTWTIDGNTASYGTSRPGGSTTINAVLAGCPSCTVLYIAFNQGDTASNYVGMQDHLDNVSFTIGGVTTTYDFELSAAGGAGACGNDGRVNSLCWDPWATSAAYCSDQGLEVYAIDEDGVGEFSFRVTPEESAAAGIPDGAPVIIDQSADGTIRVYRLNDGRYQLVSPMESSGPDGYQFAWVYSCNN